ncbi:hypothetical protein QI045_12605 [Staphylococcus saprophyticus]|nr:hypothetical protein [Staphylococcus saprophyticus]
MSKKWYIIIISISLILLLGVINLVRMPSDDSQNKSENTQSVKSDYSKKEKEKAEKRTDIQYDVENKIEDYIRKYYSPKDQAEYDEAIAMRSQSDEKQLKKSVKELIKDKEPQVNDVYISTDFSSPKEITGTYEFVYQTKDDENQNKSGDFELKTNDNGYFYIDKFN